MRSKQLAERRNVVRTLTGGTRRRESDFVLARVVPSDILVHGEALNTGNVHIVEMEFECDLEASDAIQGSHCWKLAFETQDRRGELRE